MANSLCRRCIHWGDASGDHLNEYCHLREKQVWFGKKDDEPRASLYKEKVEGPWKTLPDRDRRDGPWQCDAFEEIRPDWRHA